MEFCRLCAEIGLPALFQCRRRPPRRTSGRTPRLRDASRSTGFASGIGAAGGHPDFGDGYPTPDGTCIRDYIHVTDFCQAHLLDGGDCDAYNLCNGASFSVLEVIESARKVTGQKIFIDHVPRRLRPSTPELATPLRRSGCHRGACLAMRAQP